MGPSACISTQQHCYRVQSSGCAPPHPAYQHNNGSRAICHCQPAGAHNQHWMPGGHPINVAAGKHARRARVQHTIQTAVQHVMTAVAGRAANVSRALDGHAPAGLSTCSTPPCPQLVLSCPRGYGVWPANARGACQEEKCQGASLSIRQLGRLGTALCPAFHELQRLPQHSAGQYMHSRAVHVQQLTTSSRPSSGSMPAATDGCHRPMAVSRGF